MAKRIRVLVVDDLPDYRMTLSGLLSDEGYVTQVAASAAQALELSVQEHFDVALLDLRLNALDEDNTDGLTLAADLKRRFPGMPIVIITGYGTPDTMRRAMQPDVTGRRLVDGYLPKTQMEELVTTMNSLLNRSLQRQLPTFEQSRECEVTVSLEPGQRLLVRGRGSIRFTYTSTNPLSLDPARFTRWGSERMMSTADCRFRIKEAGQELYRLLFEQHSSVLNGYHRALGRVTKKQYLHLVFESTRDLAGLPLEFLFSKESSDYLTLLHPLTRQIRGVVTRRESVSPEMLRRLVNSGERLRVLLLASNTKPRIDLIDEIGEQLEDLLAPVSWLDLTYVRTEAATYSAVQEMLRGCEHHIVHYIGHGDFLEGSPEQSSLFFWEGNNRSGNVKPMNGNQLRFLLQDSDTRLFHLTCCEGTRAGGLVDLLDDDYLGIADGIIQSGVPSVLGYRWPVSAESAQRMALAFYSSVLRHGSPELALLDARQE
jgi:CheY-like chemotaxis protein